MGDKSRKTAIDIIGDVPWGTHFCQFYQTKEDLIDILVPYFEAGLENNEFCMWITSEPLNSEDAKRALKKKVKNLDDYIKKGQIEILDYSQWYTKPGYFDSEKVLEGWIEKEKQALERGLEGLRLTGNTLWLEKKDWKDFTDYEAAVNSVIGQHQMLAVCTYSLEKCTPLEIIDVVSNHEFALIRRAGKWKIIGSAEYKRTIEALRRSEANYRTIFDTTNDGIFVHDTESGKILSVNQKACEIFGYTQEEFEKLTVEDISTGVPPYDQEHVVRWIKKATKKGPQVFEWICKDNTGRKFWSEINLKLAVIQDQDRMLAIVRDISERKEAEQALRLHEARLQTLLELNKMSEASQGEILDFVREEVIKITQSEFAFIGFLNEDESIMTIDSWSQEAMAQCVVIDKPMHFPIAEAGLWGEVVRQRKTVVVNNYAAHRHKKDCPEGHVPIRRFLGVPVFDVNRIVAVAAVANKDKDYDESDIHAVTSMMNDMWRLLKHKRVEEALRESENKHRTLLKNIPQKIFYKDLNSVYVLCNESYADDLKVGPHEIKGKTDYDFYPKELADKYIADDKRIIQSGKTEVIEEKYVRNGHEGTVHTFKAPVKDENGNTIGIFGIFWDITERKRMEDALHRSEEHYALAQRAAHIGSWDWNITTGKLVWSDQIEPMFGFGPGEFGATYDAFLESVHPDDRQHVVESVQACVEAGKDYAIEHRIIWSDGTIRWISETGDVVRDKSDKAIRMLGIVQDITDRKERESRQQLAEMVLERLNQKGPLPDLIRDVIELIKESTNFKAVGVRLHKGGDFPYFEVNGFPKDFVEDENYLCARNEEGEQVFDEEGHPVLSCICGSVIVGRANPDLQFFTDGGSFWTNSTTELLSSASLKTLQIPLRSRCNEAGYESVALIPLRSGDEIVGLLQLNDSRPGRFTLEMVRFFEGIGASIGIALARIRAEENMHNLAKFPSENPSPVLRIAKEGTVLYANAAGSELLKTWGCNIGEQVPEHWCQYVLRILKSGSNEELEASCGDRVFSLIIAPVVEAGYVNTYGVDITERKLAEEDLRKYRQHLEELVETRTGELTQANRQLLQEIEARKGLEKEILNVSEQERRKIGQELHDSLGQQLTGVAFMTKVLEQKLAKKSLNEAADVAKIAQLVNQATNQARSLAKGLHPIDLDTGTLMSTLQDLAESTETLFGIHCTFKCDKRIRIDNPEVAVHLYRITQEAITNAIKHGKAKNIQIDLAYDANKSVLTVRNDGIDFPKEFEARHTGMGLQIMDHRVDIIEGSLDIHKDPKGGTIMTCTFPIKRQ